VQFSPAPDRTPVWKIGPKQQQCIAVLHGGIAGCKADQAGHSDVIGVIVFDKLLAAKGMHNRCLQFAGKFDHLCMRACAPGAAEQSYLGCLVEEIRQMPDVGLARAQHRRSWHNPFGNIGIDLHQRDVAGQHNDGNTPLGDGDADRAFQDLRKLPGIGNQFDIMAAVPEQVFRMSSLEIINPDFAAGNMGRDCQNRHMVALAIEQAIDQMQIARTAAAGTDSKISGEMSLGACRESGGLLMAHVDPAD
jgi:hypothetical protein